MAATLKHTSSKDTNHYTSTSFHNLCWMSGITDPFFSMASKWQKLKMSGRNGFAQLSTRHDIHNSSKKFDSTATPSKSYVTSPSSQKYI